jgi:2'-5' RNA ligase
MVGIGPALYQALRRIRGLDRKVGLPMSMTSNPTVRLFLALWPSAQVVRQIDAWRDGVQWPATAAPVPTERLHLTLHFIGNLPADEVDGLRRSLQVPGRGFTLHLGDAAVWANGIAALTPLATPDALSCLHNDLAMVLRGNGLHVEERTWRPHVTLARKARGSRLPPSPSIDWPVDATYALVRSSLHAGYEVLHRYDSAT